MSKPGDPNQHYERDIKKDILSGIFKPTAVPEGFEHLDTDNEKDEVVDEKEKSMKYFNLLE